MSKHTPGPWLIDGDILLTRADPFEEIYFGRVNISHAFTDDERQANHCLIAAAPDLLEALEECLPCLGWETDSLEDLQREHELGNGYAELIMRARAAIARAKGEK